LNQTVFQGGDAERALLSVLLGDVDTPYQLGTVSFRFQSLDQSLNVALQILRIGLGGNSIYSAGCPLVERLPGVVDQLLIQTSIEVSKSVSLVAPCLVGYSPQEGWLALIRSNCVRCELPLRATYFRQN
jgi:hypothetical protein